MASYTNAVSRKDLQAAAWNSPRWKWMGSQPSNLSMLWETEKIFDHDLQNWICRWGSQHIVTKSHAMLCRLCETATVHPSAAASGETCPPVTNTAGVPAHSSQDGRTEWTSSRLLPYLQAQYLSEIKDSGNWIRVYSQILHVSSRNPCQVAYHRGPQCKLASFSQPNSHLLKSLILIHLNPHPSRLLGSCSSLALFSTLQATPRI